MSAEIIRLPSRRVRVEPSPGLEKAILALIESELKRLDDEGRARFVGGLILEIGRLFTRYKGWIPQPPDGPA